MDDLELRPDPGDPFHIEIIGRTLALGLVAGGIFSFIVSFDDVPVSIFLVSVRQTTLPAKIFTAVEHGIDPGIAAVSTMLIIVTGLCLVVAERWVGFHRFA